MLILQVWQEVIPCILFLLSQPSRRTEREHSILSGIVLRAGCLAVYFSTDKAILHDSASPHSERRYLPLGSSSS